MKQIVLALVLVLAGCAQPVTRHETAIIIGAHQTQVQDQCKTQPELSWCHEHH